LEKEGGYTYSNGKNYGGTTEWNAGNTVRGVGQGKGKGCCKPRLFETGALQDYTGLTGKMAEMQENSLRGNGKTASWWS